MKFEGNGLYGDIEVNDKEKAIDTILYCLNTYQIGWDVIYVNELLNYFKINKDDFKWYDLSYMYGAYEVIYCPRYTEQKLKELDEKYTQMLFKDSLKHFTHELKVGYGNDLKYDTITDIISIDNMNEIINRVYKFNQSILSEQNEEFAVKGVNLNEFF